MTAAPLQAERAENAAPPRLFSRQPAAIILGSQMFVFTRLVPALLLWPAPFSTAFAASAASPLEALEVPASHLPEKGKANRLIGEKSPYLLQHAYNPVNWFPWEEEAFQQARRQDKPIFLSIGYSTCHWCHVMERESFSNPEIAALLNDHFVAVKVDREERPDLDSVYMAFVQTTTGRGGWPMSVFLTPQLKPFYGGTYFPPTTRGGLPAFPLVLSRIHEEWQSNRKNILDSANRITSTLHTLESPARGAEASLETLLDEGYRWYLDHFDETRGGFGSAPKFPQPVNLQFLIYYSQLKGQEKALEMALHTLRAMARGGMNDHLGGGFHRYSTDTRWFLPHFEKMLYDQAQLVVAYLEAYQISRDPYFAEVARRTLAYVQRDLAGPEGGFFSAEDADSLRRPGSSEKTEGALYVWTEQEIRGHLTEPEAELFVRLFGVRSEGNVEHDPFSEFSARNVLYQSVSLEQAASQAGLSIGTAEKAREEARRRLFELRTGRPRPALDDKVLTAWNGLMISALARAAQVLEDEAYLEPARQAARFIRTHLYDAKTGTLFRRFRDGERGIHGFLDDYAFLIQGLLDLYETSLEEEWLLWSLELVDAMQDRFWDEREAGFFSTTGRDKSVLLRMKNQVDGAEPSPNSVALLNLIRLGRMSDEPELLERAERTASAFGRILSDRPQAMPLMLVALSRAASKGQQVFLAGQRQAADTKALLREVHRRYLPHRIIFLADQGRAHRRLGARIGVLKNLRAVDGQATAYLCENYVCRLPTTDPQELGRLLER